jgi:hypothetical protein
MTSLPSTGPPETAQVRWVEVDPWTWQALAGSSVMGSVTFESRYVVRFGQGALAGVHTSLESAKSQLDAWIRWEIEQARDG